MEYYPKVGHKIIANNAKGTLVQGTYSSCPECGSSYIQEDLHSSLGLKSKCKCED